MLMAIEEKLSNDVESCSVKSVPQVKDASSQTRGCGLDLAAPPSACGAFLHVSQCDHERYYEAKRNDPATVPKLAVVIEAAMPFLWTSALPSA